MESKLGKRGTVRYLFYKRNVSKEKICKKLGITSFELSKHLELQIKEKIS
jgi:DNA-binding transcriptional regulator LsrR (DeoR family)